MMKIKIKNILLKLMKKKIYIELFAIIIFMKNVFSIGENMEVFVLFVKLL